MKKLFSAVFIATLFFCGQAFAVGNIIDRSATNTETTAQTRDDVWVSPSNIPYLGVLSKEMLDHNTEILNADRTILITDKPIQFFDANGTDRNVTLSAEASSTDLVFVIYNNSNGAGEDLVVRDDAPTTLITIGPGQGMRASCDGTSWQVLDNKGIKYDSVAGTLTISSDLVAAVGSFTTLSASTDPTDANGVGDQGYCDTRYRKASRGVNLIGTAGGVGFGVGICPPQLLPDGMVPLAGYDDPTHDDYGNYQYKDGSIMCWIPKYYYLISTNMVTIQGIDTYANEQDANADNYALHRAFIDNDIEQQGFFIDKYMCSKNAWGSGDIASSIKNGLPLSTHANHNKIMDLTACGSNAYFEVIDAAHARDGVDGAVNSSSIFHCASRFQHAALALLSLAHAQASSATTYCAWYDATYNHPKGCNNSALKDYDEVSNDAGSGDDLLYVTDGYGNCGKTGSGVPFAKSTHNGQNCGVADLNGLMWEISIGVTCIAPAAHGIEAMSQVNPCQITWTGHGLNTNDYIMILAITQADWSGCKDKLWQITKIDDNNFTIVFDASGFGTAYDAGTDPGTATKGVFYLAKQATAMKDFDSGNSGPTDHWGATGVAAMMDAFTPVFESASIFAQRMGSGANQVLSEATSGNPWLLTGMGFPKDADGIDITGTNAFGRDYYYQYIRNKLCLLSCGCWYAGADAGVWYVSWDASRTLSSSHVGLRAACYPE